MAQHIQAFVPCVRNLKNAFAVYFRDRLYNFGFLERIMRHKAVDFIGINYYARQLVELKGWGIRNLAMDTCENNHHPVKKNSLGWDIYPEGLFDALLKLKKYNLPIMITENGICTPDDSLRWEYIKEHLRSISLALQKGVDVTGYLYWDKGFGPRFGLIDVDYNTYKRTVRESAKLFGQVCKMGIMD
jgi:beta-glucosidase